MASSLKPPALPPGVVHTRRSTLLMLAGVVAAANPLPYSAAAVIPLVWAGVESVLSIRARSAAQAPAFSATQAPAPSATQAPARSAPQAPARGIASSVLGLVLACVLTGMVLFPYAFYGTSKRLQDCRLGANTAIATADCNKRYGSLDSILSNFLSAG